jgi:hypothetical protein
MLVNGKEVFYLLHSRISNAFTQKIIASCFSAPKRGEEQKQTETVAMK